MMPPCPRSLAPFVVADTLAFWSNRVKQAGGGSAEG